MGGTDLHHAARADASPRTCPHSQVGLLDIDICGPSIPKMLGLEGHEVHASGVGWSPVYVDDNLGVMSIGFMLPDPDEAVIWRVRLSIRFRIFDALSLQQNLLCTHWWLALADCLLSVGL